MQFNKIIRGHKRESNTEQDLYEIIDAGSLCTVAFTHQGQAMMLPMSYGRKDDVLYFHGSPNGFMLNQIVSNEQVCVSVTFLDGLVLAKSILDTSVNYRSVILYGKAEMVTLQQERWSALQCITEHIIPGRWDEVPLGMERDTKSPMVVKFKINSASVKIRTGGPDGDEERTTDQWSGHIPLKTIALEPIFDDKRKDNKKTLSKSVDNFIKKYS